MPTHDFAYIFRCCADSLVLAGDSLSAGNLLADPQGLASVWAVWQTGVAAHRI